jgi:hypothetical protein
VGVGFGPGISEENNGPAPRRKKLRSSPERARGSAERSQEGRPPKVFKSRPWLASLLFSKSSPARSNGARECARCLISHDIMAPNAAMRLRDAALAGRSCRYSGQLRRRQPPAAGGCSGGELGRGDHAQLHPPTPDHSRSASTNDRAPLRPDHQHYRQIGTRPAQRRLFGQGSGPRLGRRAVARSRQIRDNGQLDTTRTDHERADPSQLRGRVSQEPCGSRDPGRRYGEPEELAVLVDRI